MAGLPLAESTARQAASGPARLEAGVRAEDVEIAREPRPGFAPARALTSEPMGNETLVTFAAGDCRLVARAAPEFTAEPGSPVYFRPLPDRVHLFCAETGRRL
jgi:multiple sugar transport system ATP-binding protein